MFDWANEMKALGAVDALNLDGGGSSTLVAAGVVKNSPSDGTERPVTNALVVLTGADPGEPSSLSASAVRSLLSATPIPRTLNMSLAGIRDMSVIETPPRDRLSIQTHVVRFEQDVIARAIRTELERGGQVYLVHNRVESIFSMARSILGLDPFL
jgi:hypothetical protein